MNAYKLFGSYFLIIYFVVFQLSILAQESDLNLSDKHKLLQKKLEKCQDELTDLKKTLNEKEKRIEDLEKNPLQRTGTDRCRDCDLTGDANLFIKWNKNLESIKSRSTDMLTNEEKIIKLLCKDQDSCKAVNPYATYKGKSNDLLGKKIEDKGGSCGVLYDYAIPMSGGSEYKNSMKLYQILLSKPDQEVVESCWYVKNKLEYIKLQNDTKKDESSDGTQTVFAQFKQKQIECNKIEEQLNNDDFSLFNLPSEEFRNEEEPNVEDISGSKTIYTTPSDNTKVMEPNQIRKAK